MRVGIIGTGLIGASIGLGLRAADWQVRGWDIDPGAREEAQRRGAIEEIAPPDELAAGWSDVIVLAGPPDAIATMVAELDTHALVIDVSGVKRPIAAARRVLRYVGTHPMAGREVTGPAAATPHLFRGATWVVVPGDAAIGDVEVAEQIVETLGAKPLRMTAADHDVAVAAISHLPQLLASTLMNEAADRTDAMELVAGSFRDLTRVAASDPATWVELLDANRGPVLEVLEEFVDRLRSLADRIAAADHGAVQDELERARMQRRRLGPQTVAVRIALADEPGQLARVGHAFENAAVDVRDLQLRHAPHGGGGVLSVFVRAGDDDAMREALEAEGLLLAE